MEADQKLTPSGASGAETPAHWARHTRIAQGLPPRVADPTVLANVGAIFSAALRQGSVLPDRSQPLRVEHPAAAGPRHVNVVEHRTDDVALLVNGELGPDTAHRPAPDKAA